MELARPRASWVLPVPGLSSSRMCPPTTMAVAHWRMGASLPTTTWGDVVYELGELLMEFGDVFAGCGHHGRVDDRLGLFDGLYRLAGLDGLGWLDGLLRGHCDCRIGGRLAKVLRHRLTEPRLVRRCRGGLLRQRRLGGAVRAQQRALRILIGLRLLRQIRRVERGCCWPGWLGTLGLWPMEPSWVASSKSLLMGCSLLVVLLVWMVRCVCDCCDRPFHHLA